MTEKDIYKKYIETFPAGDFMVRWKSPAFKKMRWDIFGIFDLIEIYWSENDKKLNIRFVQLTTVSNLSHRRKKIETFFKQFGHEIPCSIWAYDKKKDNWKFLNYAL